MSSIPSSFSRVPNRLASQLTQHNITSAQVALLRVQAQLATNKKFDRPSDDPIAASLVSVLDQRLEAGEQRARNLQHAAGVLGTLDHSFDELNTSIQEAKTIASSQVGVGSDPSTRKTEAAVVGPIIDSLVATLNRDFNGLHLFSGSRTGVRPIASFHGGYRYQGQGEGHATDLGEGLDFPITVGADTAIGALSARVKGDVDLNPQLSASTLVRDLRGPGGEGATLGSIEVSIDDGSPPAVNLSVDLSKAETLGDVAKAIESAVRTADPAALGGAYPSAVGFNAERLSIGAVAAGYTITFSDGTTGASAKNLGLDGFGFTAAAPVSTAANKDLNPRLTDRTVLSGLNPAGPLVYGDVVFKNGGRQGTVTLTPAMTIGQLKQALARLDLGVRIDIDPGGNSINVVNEVSGFRMSVEEAGTLAATSLGVRTLSGTTPLSAFNDGRGVAIADAQINPLTGLPDPGRNVDFEVKLTDGSVFNVDLAPADLASVNALVAKINTAAAGAGFGAVFTAGLAASGNGIELQDTAGGAGAISVRSLNGHAADDLGLLQGTFSAGSPARLVSGDRATVRVGSVLSSLIDLRTSLLNNDSIGITFAGEGLEAGADQVLQARGLVGARASRIDDAQRRHEDTTLLDRSIKSNLQDLDLVEASTRFSILQTQLQAGLQSAASISSLSLLNFLG